MLNIIIERFPLEGWNVELEMENAGFSTGPMDDPETYELMRDLLRAAEELSGEIGHHEVSAAITELVDWMDNGYDYDPLEP